MNTDALPDNGSCPECCEAWSWCGCDWPAIAARAQSEPEQRGLPDIHIDLRSAR